MSDHRWTHAVSRVLSVILAFLLMLDVLPVKVRAEDESSFTLNQNVYYVKPGESFTLDCEYTGMEPVLVEDQKDVLYGGDEIQLLQWDGLTATAVDNGYDGYGFVLYSVMQDDLPVGQFEVYVTEQPTSIYFMTNRTTFLANSGGYDMGVTTDPDTAKYAHLVYTSSDDTVAEFRDGGLYPISAGTVEIAVGTDEDPCLVSMSVTVVEGDYVTWADYNTGSNWVILRPGETCEQPFVLYPKGNSFADDTINYYSDNESVAIIDPVTGAVTAVGPGTATITVTAVCDVEKSMTVQVTSPVEEMHFEDDTYYRNINDTERILDRIVFTPREAAHNDFIVTSSDESVVSVYNNEYVLFNAVGSAVITVTDLENPDISTSCTIHVIDMENTQVTMLNDRMIYLEAGQSTDLQFEGADATGIEFNKTDCDENYGGEQFLYFDGLTVTADPNGYGYAEYAVYAYDKYVDTVTIFVYDGEPESMWFDNQSETTFLTYGNHRYTLNCIPDSARYAPYEVTIDNEDVLKQSDRYPYTFEFTGTGTAVITVAAANGESAVMTVTVLDGDYVREAYINTGVYEYYLKPGETLDNPFSFVSTYGNGYDDDTITYTSDDEDIAAVDPVTGEVTAVSGGYTPIRVYGAVGELSSYTVYVSEEPEYIAFTNDTYTKRQYSSDNILNLMEFQPENARYSRYTYSSSNEDVVYIDNSGYMSYYDIGESVITVTYEDNPDITASCTVNVIDPSSIDVRMLNDHIIYLEPGQSFDLQFEGLNGMEVTVENNGGNYYSPSGDLAAFSGTTFTAAEEGEGYQRFSLYVMDQYIDKLIIMVSDCDPEEMNFFNSSDVVFMSDEFDRYEPHIYPFNARYSRITMTSDNENVLRPNSYEPFEFDIVGTGTATVTAVSQNGLTAEMTVTVLDGDYVTSAYTETNAYYLKPGETLDNPFSFDTTYENGYGDDTVTYTSDIEETAIVDPETGDVTAVAAGETSIHVHGAAGELGSYAVYVSEDPESIAFTNSTYTKELYGMWDVRELMEFQPADARYSRYIYSSSNENAVSIGSNGMMYFGDIGESVITVTFADDPSITASCTINVVEEYTIDVRMLNDRIIYLEPGESFDLQFEGLNEMEVTFMNAGSDYDSPSGNLVEVSGTTITAAADGRGYQNFNLYVMGQYVDELTVMVSDCEPETMNFYNDTDLLFMPDSAVRYELETYPYYARYSRITMTSDNENVLRPSTRDTRTLDIVGAGTAVITATAQNGLTAEMTVTVLDGDYVRRAYIETDIYEYYLKPGETLDNPFSFETTYENGYGDDTVTYSSDDENIASVDPATGDVTAVSAGDTMIRMTCTAGELNSYRVYVSEEPESIAFTKDTYTKTVNGMDNVRDLMEFQPENARYSRYIYSSSNEDVISIDSDGDMYYHNTGTSVITVTYEDDPNITASCTINVIDSADITFTLLSENPMYLKPGERRVVDYEITGGDIVPEFSQISSSGSYSGYLVRGEGNAIVANESGYGEAEVGVYIGSQEVGSFKVYVSEDPESISFYRNSMKALLKNGAVYLGISVEPYTARNAHIIYSSSDENVIRPSGTEPNRFDLISTGTATIYADTENGLHAEMEVTVVEGDYVEGFDYSSEPFAQYGKVGETINIPVKLYPEGNAFADDHISYMSADPTIARINDDNTITMLKAGRTWINVYTDLYPYGYSITVYAYEDPAELTFKQDVYEIASEVNGKEISVYSDLDPYTLPIVWTISDTSVVTGNEYGADNFIRYVSPGTATIRAAYRDDPSIYAECTVNTYVPVAQESINVEDEYTVYTGLMLEIMPEFMPEKASTRITAEAIGNEDRIVNISTNYSTGEVTVYGYKPGTVTVVFKSLDGTLQDSAVVHVVEGRPEIKDVTYNVDELINQGSSGHEVSSPAEVTFAVGSSYIINGNIIYEKLEPYEAVGINSEIQDKLLETGKFKFANVHVGAGAAGRPTNDEYFLASVEAIETGDVVLDLFGKHTLTIHIIDPVEVPEDAVVRIGPYPYTDLQNAVDAVKDGELIIAMTDEPLSAVVNEPVSFSIEKPENMILTAGEGIRLSEENETYNLVGKYWVGHYTFVSGNALTHVEAVPVSCNHDGNTEYWIDETTGKYYSDAEGTNEIEEGSWIIPATGHDIIVTEWNWAPDYSYALGLLGCAHGCGYKLWVDAQVTTATVAPTAAVEGYTVYTATVRTNGKEFTDRKTVSIPVESPTVLTLTNVTSTGYPSIAWESRECAVKYQLYRSTEESGTYTKIADTAETEFVDTAAVGGTEYFYKVRCVGTDNKAGAFSSIESIDALPAQPSGLTLVTYASTGNIKLTWEDARDAEKYQVYRSTSSNGTYTRIGTAEDSSYIDTTGVSGQKYYYKVRAVTDNSVYSKYSSKKSIECNETVLTAEITNESSTGYPSIAWTDADDVKYYQLFRAEEENGTYQKLGNVSASEKIDETAEAGKTYWYKVRAVDPASKVGSYSEPVSITALPAQPTGIATKSYASTGNIKISWDEARDAVKYQVYRATSSNGTYTRIATTENTFYVDTTGTSGKTYYYKVRSVTENSVYSKFSSKKSAKCTEETITVTAANVTASGIPKVTWTTVNDVKYYQLFRAEAEDGTYQKIGNFSVTEKTDSTAEAGKTYWYKVRAVDSNSKVGTYSEPVSIVCKPARVTGLKATNVSSTGKPKLTWTAVDDAAKYQVYYSTSKSGTYKRLATTANTSYTHSKAEAGQTYYYKVRAMSENGTYGAFSTIVSRAAK